MPDLLIEIFSEEIPARMQTRAADDLRRLVTDGLVQAGLTYAHAGAFSTPRRLVLAVEGLLGETPILRESKRGPSIDAKPQAIAGFMRGLGIEAPPSWYDEKIAELSDGNAIVGDSVIIRVEEVKGKRALMATLEYLSRPAAEIVAEVLENAIRTFPWPKSMRWGAGSLRWVRPLHSILCLLTDEAGASVVPLEVDGITAGDTTEGHRFMGAGRFSVTSFADFEAKLKRAHVVLRADERAEAIWNDATQMAFAQGLEVVEDRGLLAEVAGLVEWPVVLMGDIGADFLGLPPEVLQTSMKEHQKFFSVRNPGTGRIEKFVTVANIETADNGATILAGNIKVLSARLSDAKFFWENDLRTVARVGLEGLAAGQGNVTFHAKLGSQAERVDRIAALAREIAPMVGADADEAELAARVCKADLMSEMVYEFPELQGVMGRYYAKSAGLSDAVADACAQHYSPLGPSDDVPTAPVSVAVALADKLWMLCSFWGIDEVPTGSKDPFALRRAGLGVIRIVLANDCRIGLNSAGGPLEAAFIMLATTIKTTGNELKKENLLAFLHERLKVHLRDEGLRHDVIDACLSVPNSAPSGATPGNDDLTLLVKRARALSETLKTDDGANLVQGFKRANNILAQAEEKDGVEYSFGADRKFAEDPAETALFDALDAADAEIAPAMQAEDFAAAMTHMAALRAPIDAFFEAVQINTDNEIVRRNRLNLLNRIRTTCLSVADLTKLDG